MLGKADDAARYADQLAKIKEAFRREFVTDGGRVGEGTQTAYALALQFDLLPEALRPVAAGKLAEDVRTRKHLTTGFLGTPYLCHVLSRYGYLDEAYLLLNREEYPSWLYPVKQGATTIWERWDGQKPDGTFQITDMNSFNHYAYGAIGEWMYRVMAGIEIDEAAPGYKHILIQPQPGGGFTSVTASHETPYGKVASAWTLQDGRFELAVEVPPNTRATVRLPKARARERHRSRERPWRMGTASRVTGRTASVAVVEVGSGQYRFAYAWGGMISRASLSSRALVLRHATSAPMSYRRVGGRVAGIVAAVMAAAGLTAALGAQGPAKANWLTDGYDKERTSWQRNETLLSPDTVGRMKLLWKVQLDNPPRQMHNLFPALIVGDVLTAQGRRELAIVAGVSDNIYGIDVETGTQIWKRHFDSTFVEDRPPRVSTCCARAA